VSWREGIPHILDMKTLLLGGALANVIVGSKVRRGLQEGKAETRRYPAISDPGDGFNVLEDSKLVRQTTADDCEIKSN